MNIDYCDEWLESERKVLNLFDAEWARRRHESRQRYVAIIGGIGDARFIVDVSNEWVSVSFLDDLFRKWLQYDFESKPGGRLFLKSANHWKYEGDSDHEVSLKVFNFSEDGLTIMADHDVPGGTISRRETRASVAENWDAYPSFGEYRALCRCERTPPWPEARG